MEEPDFWDVPERSQQHMKTLSDLKEDVATYKKLQDQYEEIELMIEMGYEENDPDIVPEIEEMLQNFQETFDAIRIKTLLSGEYDTYDAIVTLHAGAGGTESCDWASMLYRMYTRWADKKGFSIEVLDYLDGDEAGIKSVTFQVNGTNAYGYLKSERGVHRLVRISPFDSSGRRHTSFSAVEVMPEIDDDTEVDIRPEEIDMQVFRSSGAGGQHINKTSSAVRLTHKPTGIVVSCQTERSQFQNRDNCMKMLRAKLVEIKEREREEKMADIKGEMKKIEWGSQIRSYVFMPYTLAKDTRTGFENSNIDAVMDGDIDGFITAYLTAQATGELKAK